MKGIQRILFMVKSDQWRTRTNPTEDDLTMKNYLLRIIYKYSIELTINEYFFNVYIRTIVDSII
jgi:hypothetical protein